MFRMPTLHQQFPLTVDFELQNFHNVGCVVGFVVVFISVSLSQSQALLHLDRVALRAARRCNADALVDAGALEALFVHGVLDEAAQLADADGALDAALMASAPPPRWLPLHVTRRAAADDAAGSLLVLSAPLPDATLTARRKNAR